MRQHILEALGVGAVALVTLVWLEVLPMAWLAQLAVALLAWALLSTLLVGSAAAWVALSRSRARARAQRRMPHPG